MLKIPNFCDYLRDAASGDGNDISGFENLHFFGRSTHLSTFGGLENGSFCAARARGCKFAQSAFIP